MLKTSRVRKAKSKLALSRQKGKHQVGQQRDSILDAAERLFLQRGLEHTTMVDIAAQAGVTKITLYRYFQNRDVIALEIQVRMMQRIGNSVGISEADLSLDTAKRFCQAMIRNFAELRDAFRYMSMFDQRYLDKSPDTGLTQWTKAQLSAWSWKGMPAFGAATKSPNDDRFHMVMSSVVWFLEKLAMRGELTWSDPSVPLETHLKLFEDMVIGYIDRIAEVQHTTS